jgi:HD-GYP domain-containing protein (c-di-GMP phosphodiesterase class II)
LHSKQPRQDIERRIQDLENEIKRLKKHEQATRRELKTAQAELQSSSDRLRKTMGGIIQAMSLTIEKRDPYTAGHQRRVTKLCRAIATIMGFSWERIQGFRMAAAIHDVGKIRVPAEILSKPGRLTENEFGIIKTHPQIGFDILKGIEFAWPIAQIVFQHHERMDGSGYPQGLSGAEILTEARILAVADVVEAMSSHRPYRPALGLDKATAEIRQNKGVLYDADVVDACLKAMAENKTLLDMSMIL